jgi:SH3-like domain-containing protein
MFNHLKHTETYSLFISVFFIFLMVNALQNMTKANNLLKKPVSSPFKVKTSHRFASLRSNHVNLRAGPGVRYPVNWVYRTKYLPVEIIAEFENWRKVRDVQGTQGWIHQAMLSTRRMLIVIGQTRTLRKHDDRKSRAVAQLETNVIGKLNKCPNSSGWCEVTAGGYKGWLRRVDFWGVYAEETIN